LAFYILLVLGKDCRGLRMTAWTLPPCRRAFLQYQASICLPLTLVTGSEQP